MNSLLAKSVCRKIVWHISDFSRNLILMAGRENVVAPFRQAAFGLAGGGRQREASRKLMCGAALETDAYAPLGHYRGLWDGELPSMGLVNMGHRKPRKTHRLNENTFGMHPAHPCLICV